MKKFIDFPPSSRPDPHARPSARALLASGRAELASEAEATLARERAHKDMLCAALAKQQALGKCRLARSYTWT